MSIQFALTAPNPIAVKLVTTNPTIVAGSATARTVVDWLQCTEIAGATPNLTIDIFDGTTIVFLRNAKAMTAKEEVLLIQGFALNPGQYLRVTTSVANQVDVTGMAGLQRG